MYLLGFPELSFPVKNMQGTSKTDIVSIYLKSHIYGLGCIYQLVIHSYSIHASM